MVPHPDLPPIHFDLAGIKLFDPNVPPVRIQDHDIPQRFTADFSVMGGKVIFNDWKIALEVFVEPDGTPRAREVRIYSVSNGATKWPFIQRWQLELVENEFHRLLMMAVNESAMTYFYVKQGKSFMWQMGEYEHTTKKFTREVERLTHRRINDSEHFAKVASIYNEELLRATEFGKRPRMIKEIMDRMNTSRGTAESWVRTAKAIPGLIKPATPKKKPLPNGPIGKAKASNSKSSTTKPKKGKS